MVENIITVLIATIVSFIIGMLWYSPILFLEPWRRGAKLKIEQMKPQFSVMVVWVISSFVMTYALSIFLQYANATSIMSAVIVAFYTWLAFVATAMLGSVIWEKKPISFYLINTLYFLVTMIVSAILLVTI